VILTDSARVLSEMSCLATARRGAFWWLTDIRGEALAPPKFSALGSHPAQLPPSSRSFPSPLELVNREYRTRTFCGARPRGARGILHSRSGPVRSVKDRFHRVAPLLTECPPRRATGSLRRARSEGVGYRFKESSMGCETRLRICHLVTRGQLM